MGAAPSLLILGASARAAAQSAARSGFRPQAIDLFADLDLQAAAAWARCEDYPRGLPMLARQQPQAPWMYTGALENCPRIVDEIAAVRPLWGNSGDVLRAVRDPASLFASLESAGMSVPPWTLGEPSDAGGALWLSKPLRSAGGAGIAWREMDAAARGELSDSKADRADRFFQQFVPGTPCAAVYVGCGGQARLLGVTRQLIGQPWTGASGFRYCGSIGPLDLPAPLEAEIVRLGNHLAAAFDLRGIFGVDAILAPGDALSQARGVEKNLPSTTDSDGLCDPEGAVPPDARVWPIEVNPRYTASVEVLERALGWRSIELHRAACCDRQLPAADDCAARRHRVRAVCGKAILFARDAGIVPSEMPARLLAENAAEDWPRWADIPAAGSPILAGWPVLTALGTASTIEMVWRQLQGAMHTARAATAVPEFPRP